MASRESYECCGVRFRSREEYEKHIKGHHGGHKH
jgi:uncharacterized C2H2 Zn-finger protein